MIRNLKVLGLALVAVFAMSAMTTSTAWATNEGEFTADEYPAHLDGVDLKEVGTSTAFTGLGQEVTCDKVTYTGAQVAPVTELTIEPKYEECHTAGKARPATVTMNGCDYTFRTAQSTGTHTWSVLADLTCETGEGPVEVHIYNNVEPKHTSTWCTLSIFGGPGQNKGLAGLTATNETGAEDSTDSVKLKGTLEKISSHAKGTCTGGLTIPFNGLLHVNATVEGTDDEENHNGVRIS